MGVHINKHKSKKPFSCLRCSFSANRESSFRSHMERVHPQDGCLMKHQSLVNRHQGRIENRNSTNTQAADKSHQGRPENLDGASRLKPHQEKIETQNEDASVAASDTSDDHYDLGFSGNSGPRTPEPEAVHYANPILYSISTQFETPRTNIPPGSNVKQLESDLGPSPDLHVPERVCSCERSQIISEAPNLSSSASTNFRKIFKCDKCTFSTMNESLIQLHAKQQCVAPSSECNQLRTETPGSSGLASPQREIFKCEDCPFATRKKPLLERHSAKHLIDSSFVCSHCGFREANSIKFAKHLASNHSTKRRSVCCFCSYSSLRLRNLAAHLEIHRPVRMADCPECDMSYTRKSHLNKHFKKRHMNGKQSTDVHLLQSNSENSVVDPDASLFPPVTGAAATARGSTGGNVTKQQLIPGLIKTEVDVPSKSSVSTSVRSAAVILTKQIPGSIRTEVPSKPAISTLAGSVAVAVTKQIHESINIVVNVPSKPLYQCSSCNFSTKRKDLLRRHVVKHLLPDSYFVCPICKFSESSTQSFLAHLMSHESRPRLECCFCYRIFKPLKELRRHMEVHRAVHFYDCPVCGKTYSQFTALRKHCKEAHVKNVQCPDCGKVTTKAKLHSHRRLHRLKILRQKRRGSRQKQQGSRQRQRRSRQKQRGSPKSESKPKAEPKQEQFHLNAELAADDILCTDPYTNTINDPPTSSIENTQLLALSYLCSYCNYGTNIESLYTRHVAKHDMEEAVLVCPTCHFKSSEVVSFGKHLVSQHGSTNCCWCEYKTYCKSSLVRHLECHRAVHFKDCPMCDRSYTHQKSLNSHYSKYHVQKTECPDCDECMTHFELIEHSKIHGKSIDVTKHVELDIDDPSVFRCYHCSYTTTKKSLLRRHAGKHLLDTRIVCPYCDFAETNAREFAKHCVSCQGGFVCSFCSFSTFRIRSLSDHIETHRNVLIHDCTKCEFSCSTRSRLRDHNKNMHIAQHQCTYCNKAMTKYQLSWHKLKHVTAEKTLTDIEHSPGLLSSHDEHSAKDAMSSGENVSSEHGMPSNDPEIPHIRESLLCGYCDFSTDTMSLLEKHLPVHVEQGFSCGFVKFEPFATHVTAESSVQSRLLCGYCDFSTVAQSSLEDHLANHANFDSVAPEFIALDPDLTSSALGDPTDSHGASDMDIEYADNSHSYTQDDDVAIASADDDNMCIDNDLSGITDV